MTAHGVPSGVVNPARAGMIPDTSELRSRRDGKPRASGDDPVLATAGGICLG